MTVGVERFTANAAVDHSLAYGVVTAVIRASRLSESITYVVAQFTMPQLLFTLLPSTRVYATNCSISATIGNIPTMRRARLALMPERGF